MFIAAATMSEGKMFKGGLESESAGKFFTARINIPFYYPKLLHLVHGMNKLIIQSYDF